MNRLISLPTVAERKEEGGGCNTGGVIALNEALITVGLPSAVNTAGPGGSAPQWSLFNGTMHFTYQIGGVHAER